jgi:MFS family permease
MSAIMLLITRLIEGIGFGLIGVIAPAIIAACFPPEKRGLPMSIWSCWVPIGILFIFNSANLFIPAGDPGAFTPEVMASAWKGVWWLINGLLAGVLALFILVIKVPETPPHPQGEAGGAPPSFIDVLKSVPAWCLAIIFLIFAMGVGALTTFAPTYIQSVPTHLVNGVEVGFTPQEANMYSGLFLTIGMITGGIVMGIALNALAKYRSIILIVGAALTAVAFYFIFEFTGSMILGFMLVGGFIFQMLPATIFTVGPEAAPSPPTIGLTMGLIILGQNTGGLGPGILSSIMARPGDPEFAAAGYFDWHVGTIILVVLGVVATVMSVVYYFAKKKQAAK